jgi:hypothetical protein
MTVISKNLFYFLSIKPFNASFLVSFSNWFSVLLYPDFALAKSGFIVFIISQ